MILKYINIRFMTRVSVPRQGSGVNYAFVITKNDFTKKMNTFSIDYYSAIISKTFTI